MNRFFKHLGLCAALAASISTGAAGTTPAPAAAQAEAKLAAVRARIGALTTRLGAEVQERDALAARLRQADLDITAKRRTLDDLRSAEAAAERRRAELGADAARIGRALDAERAALAAQARAAYLIGGGEWLKLLLNQGDAAAAGRMSAYYGYLARARAHDIAVIDQELRARRDLLAEIDRTGSRLAELHRTAVRDLDELTLARRERAAAATAVAAEVDTGTRHLAELEREAQAEEALLADLSRVLKDFPVETPQNFDSMRGRLAWPVQGRITAHREHAEPGAPVSRWTGLLIEAPRGAKVRAAYYGRVIYADWLQGLGLLLIIGHSGNYMTLYGHAEVLYKSVGDWVAPGDVIAALGEPAGGAPQLYFEIRDGRTPMDAKAWLKSAP